MTTVYAAPPETATEPLVDRVGYRRDTFEFVWDGGKYIDAYLAGEADPFLSITATYPDGTHRDATPGRLRAVVDRYIDAPERRVEVRPGLTGTCDLYDTDTRTRATVRRMK